MASSSIASFVSEGRYDRPITFATYNILRSKVAEETPGLSFRDRMWFILKQISHQHLDVLVLQECRRFTPDGMHDAIDDFYNELRNYGYELCLFRPNPSDLAMNVCIAYHKAYFMCTKTETMWLSTTPDVPSADYGWGKIVGACTLCPIDIETGKVFCDSSFVAAVTHFSLKEEEKMAEARILKSLIKERFGERWILGGDFNTFPDAPSSGELTALLAEGCTELTAPERMGGKGTWLGTWLDHPVPKGETGATLDHIYCRGFLAEGEIRVKINNYKGMYATERKCNQCPSDHAMVLVSVKLK